MLLAILAPQRGGELGSDIEDKDRWSGVSLFYFLLLELCAYLFMLSFSVSGDFKFYELSSLHILTKLQLVSSLLLKEV